SSIAGLVYFGRHGWIRPGGVKRVFVRSITMSMPSGIAIIGLVIMSKIMGGTGQTSVLADGIARVLGKTYVILAPLVGMVGSFMTGSNMSSNILFGEFQVTTANLLHLNQAPILGAQTAGGSIGSAISPSNIILGTTTAGILGSEGQVLKRIIPFTTIMTLAIGIIVFLSVAVS
ncbi:MAG: L-lactate permease, partial [Enterocloster bolteae]